MGGGKTEVGAKPGWIRRMRYKGRSSEKTLARDLSPLGGFGRKLDTMHAHLRGVAYHHRRGRHEGEQDITRWLFALREDAEAFAQAFGGTVLD